MKRALKCLKSALALLKRALKCAPGGPDGSLHLEGDCVLVRPPIYLCIYVCIYIYIYIYGLLPPELLALTWWPRRQSASGRRLCARSAAGASRAARTPAPSSAEEATVSPHTALRVRLLSWVQLLSYTRERKRV